MDNVTNQIDKAFSTELLEDYGNISIRIIVLQKSAEAPTSLTPEDSQTDEPIIDKGKTPVSSYLEDPKRGKKCVVFLVNGQRQHAWDNSFIQSDLEFKYLRNRMIVIVDVDGMKPEAIADLMQGSRNQFYEGKVYEAISSRVIATLKGDPDLIRLEAEAEEEIYELKSGDEVVKRALDKLIDEHHNMSKRIAEGSSEVGEKTDAGYYGTINTKRDVVMKGDSKIGIEGEEPLLIISPEGFTIRLKPNESRKLILRSVPNYEWGNIEDLNIAFDPPINEISMVKNTLIQSVSIDLTFIEPRDFDQEEYPIETTLRITAKFKDRPEPRIVERRLLVNRPRIIPPQPTPKLMDEPTFLKVTSRQPVKFCIGGPDVHIKLRWDGKDYLSEGDNPLWYFEANCVNDYCSPNMTFSKPNAGRLELLVQIPENVNLGETLSFEVAAFGPEGKLLRTTFIGEVVSLPGPRRVSASIRTGGHRRSPYELKYIKKEQYDQETCWGASQWTENDPGCFQDPTSTSPLILLINEDMKELDLYRDRLINKRLAESTIENRTTKYVSHIAFHLYQIYRSYKEIRENESDDVELPEDEDMRREIRRVAVTLLTLMEI